MTDKEQLSLLLKDMDIPEWRRDVSKTSNLLWLGRNLAIKNGEALFIESSLFLVRKMLGRNHL